MSSNSDYYKDLDETFTTDANFKVDINQKMQVPNRISFNANGVDPAWATGHETFNMQVPERILVVGQQQHLGTRAPPREIVFDNSILPTDSYPADVRVATPPRSLTLDKYPFPGVNDYEDKQCDTESIPVIKAKSKLNVQDSLNKSQILHDDDVTMVGIADGLAPTDEILHLRRQMARLNRRVLSLESENLNRLQKEKILYGLGIAYFLLKVIIWMNRSS